MSAVGVAPAPPAAAPAARVGRRPLPALESARVAVVGDTPITQALIALLLRSGVGWAEMTVDPAADDHDLVVDLDLDPDRPLDWEALPPCLRVRVGRHEVEIGPLFSVPDGVCPDCFGRTSGPWGQPDDPTPQALSLGLGLTVQTVVAIFGRLAPWAWRGFTRVRLPDFSAEKLPVSQDPGCARCGVPGIELDPAECRVLERARQADQLLLARAEARAVSAPPRPTKRYLTLAASPPTDDRSAPIANAVRVALGRTAADPRPDDRPAPSVAGVRSLRAYLLVPSGPDRTQRYYLDAENEMLTLGDHWSSGPLSRATRALVVFTGDAVVAERQMPQYGHRAMYQDAGMALASLEAACQGRGLDARVRSVHEHTAIGAELQLDPEREPVLLTVDVRDAATPRADDSRPPHRARSGALDAALAHAIATSASTRVGRQWQPVSANLLLLAREVEGLRPGLYRLGIDGWRPAAARLRTTTDVLSDRAMDPAAVLLAAGKVIECLAAQGPAGYGAVLTQSAALVEAASRTAAAAHVTSEALARLPARWLERGAADPGESPRILMALALGGEPHSSQEALRW